MERELQYTAKAKDPSILVDLVMMLLTSLIMMIAINSLNWKQHEQENFARPETIEQPAGLRGCTATTLKKELCNNPCHPGKNLCFGQHDKNENKAVNENKL